jgi:hypothetical protein
MKRSSWRRRPADSDLANRRDLLSLCVRSPRRAPILTPFVSNSASVAISLSVAFPSTAPDALDGPYPLFGQAVQYSGDPSPASLKLRAKS